MPDHELAVLALVAFYARRFRGRLGRQHISVGVDLDDRLACRVVGTAEERPETTEFVDQRFAAIGAFMLGNLFFEHVAVFVAWAGKFALRISAAAQKFAVFAESVDHFPLAFGTGIFTGRSLRLCVLHLFGGLVEVVLEGPVELLENADPLEVLFLNLVELLFHVAGKGDVHDLGEKLAELVGDDLADIGGVEFGLLLFDVLSVLDRRNNAGIGTWPSDPFLFQGPYQRGLGVSRRRLGEVLAGLDIDRGDGVADLHRRQDRFIGVGPPNLCKSVKNAHPARSFVPARADRCLRLDLDSGGVPLGWGHLAGDETTPDHIIELELLVGEERSDIGRCKVRIGGPDGLVGLLGALLGGVKIGLFGQIVVADVTFDVTPGGI